MPKRFKDAVECLRAAGEPTRLRLLALLARAELTVGELCEIVNQSQPRVSRHLKLLSDAGLIDRFREQHWVYYRAPTAEADQRVFEQVLSLADENDSQLVRDRRRMDEVIAERGRRAADQLGSGTRDEADQPDLGNLLLAELGDRSLGALLDVGTGRGAVLRTLAPHAHRAVGVDISSEALRVARTNVHRLGLSHCEFQRGDMYNLPFHSPTFDTVTMDRVLAGAKRPQSALAEAARALKSDGRLVILEEFDRMAEAWQANPIVTLRAWLKDAGLTSERLRPIDTEYGHLIVVIARHAAKHRAAAA